MSGLQQLGMRSPSEKKSNDRFASVNILFKNSLQEKNSAVCSFDSVFIYSAGAKDYKVASPDKKIEVTP
jgi:hypothetical protein